MASINNFNPFGGNWFRKPPNPLPPLNNILSFSDPFSPHHNSPNLLRHRFLTQFSTSRTYQRTTTSLINFKQGPDESLKEFMGRFNSMAIQIRDLNPAVSLHAILAGLRDGPFADSLTRRPPADLDELRTRAIGYINVEEAALARRQITKTDGGKGATTSGPPKNHNEGGSRRDRDRRPFPHRRTPTQPKSYDSYTPFNARREDILKEIYNTNLISLPPPPRAQPSYIDRNKHCTFHRAFGHNTEDCIGLRDVLESLARNGHLDRFIRRVRERSREGRVAEAQIAQPRRPPIKDRSSDDDQEAGTQLGRIKGVINTISGGFAGGGESSSARKRHLRAVQTVMSIGQGEAPPSHSRPNQPSITFTDADFRGTDKNQDDPMVISVTLAGFEVRRVLVDQGSSADILYWDVFQQLDIPDSALKPFAGNLIGFAGEQVRVKGYVELITTFAGKKNIP